MIKLLGTVKVPKTVIILAAAANAAAKLGIGDVTVTSGNDSTHMVGSKHYTDEALDFRVKGLTQDKVKTWRTSTLLRLGPGYQAMVEDFGKPNAHLHVEWDPS